MLRFYQSNWLQLASHFGQNLSFFIVYKAPLKQQIYNNLSAAKKSIIVLYDALWKQDIVTKPKLRLYHTYKDTFVQKSYLSMDIPKYKQSLLVHLRTGILPLGIETGGFQGESEHIHVRLCNF